MSETFSLLSKIFSQIFTHVTARITGTTGSSSTRIPRFFVVDIYCCSRLGDNKTKTTEITVRFKGLNIKRICKPRNVSTITKYGIQFKISSFVNLLRQKNYHRLKPTIPHDFVRIYNQRGWINHTAGKMHRAYKKGPTKVKNEEKGPYCNEGIKAKNAKGIREP